MVRKSKKVLVPSNAISRVIGRGGCNINTIREVSGAHIEVEKQKGQGDRMVIIRGSADATRHAHTLITVLSKETEKELVEIIRELGLDSCTSSTSATTTTINTATTAATASVALPEVANGSSSSTAPTSIETTEHKEPAAQSSTVIQALSVTSSSSSSARGSKAKAVSAGVKSAAAATTSYAVSNPTMIFTSSSLSKTSKNPSSIVSMDTTNWTNSYGKAAATSQTTATSSTTANSVSYTKAISSKTRNSSNTTTASSVVSSDAENGTTSPAAMSAVPIESVEHIAHRDSSQRSTPTMQIPRQSPFNLQQSQPQPPIQPPPQQQQQKLGFTSANIVDGLVFDSSNQVLLFMRLRFKMVSLMLVFLFYRCTQILIKAMWPAHCSLRRLNLWPAVFQAHLFPMPVQQWLSSSRPLCQKTPGVLLACPLWTLLIGPTPTERLQLLKQQ